MTVETCPACGDSVPPEEWRYLRDNEPEAFAKAIALDDEVK